MHFSLIWRLLPPLLSSYVYFLHAYWHVCAACTNQKTVWHTKNYFSGELVVTQNNWNCAINEISIIDVFWTHIIECFSDWLVVRNHDNVSRLDIHTWSPYMWVRSNCHCWSGAITAAKIKVISTFRNFMFFFKLRYWFGLKLNIPVRIGLVSQIRIITNNIMLLLI